MTPGDQPLQIVGLGMATVDILARMREMPCWEHGTRLDDLTLDGGGPVGTAMVAAARLGARAGFIGTAGDDETAELKLRLFSKEGVDISRVVRRPIPEPQVILVCVNSACGERIFSGTGRTGTFPLEPEELDRAYITQAGYLHLDGFHLRAALQAAEWMHAAGKCVVLDAAKSDGNVADDFRELVRRSDIVISGAGFARAFSGRTDFTQAGLGVLEAGPRVFVETLGEDGCVTFSAEGWFHTPAFPVEVVDTTGAGDVFHGAYLVGLLHGWGLERTAQFASAVAAIKCMQMGGRRGIPTIEQVFRFLAQRRPDEWESLCH